MKNSIFIFLNCFIAFLFFTLNVFAQSKILINEFLIDPQPQTVEILNSGTESTDVSDWIIDDSGGTTFYTIPKNNIILPNQCMVFSADFNLNKTSADTIRLINSSQQLIDSFSYKASSGSGTTFFRLPDGSDFWTTGSANLGSYNQTDISCLITPTSTPTPSPTPTPIQPDLTGSTDLTDSPTITYDNIYISEVMANPVTGEKEWMEIFNNNDFPVYLDRWYIDDLENDGSSPKIFSLEITAKGYGIFDLASSMFNNDGDSVRLLDFNKNLKDDFEYKETEQGKTLGRIFFGSNDFCPQISSKNYTNNACINPVSLKISSTLTKPADISAIISNVPSNTPVKVRQVRQNINYPTGIVLENDNNGEVLGVVYAPTNESILFVRFLTFVSTSYSLLTIISILFKMKLGYGKSQNFHSSSLNSP